jgi:hypothetical protein
MTLDFSSPNATSCLGPAGLRASEIQAAGYRQRAPIKASQGGSRRNVFPLRLISAPEKLLPLAGI